jgi:hypothetical protein
LQLSGHILQASGCRMLPLAIGIHWVSLVRVCQPLISLIEFCWKIVESYWAYDTVCDSMTWLKGKIMHYLSQFWDWE